MLKKLFIFTGTILLLALTWGGYAAIKNRRQARLEAAKNAKAPQTSIKFTEGWTNQDIADYLQKNNIVSAQAFLAAERSFDTSAYPTLASKPESADLEGFIFPDTYFILSNQPAAAASSDSILKKALDNFESKISPGMLSQAQTDKMSLFQIVTLASIVEKESSGNTQDRATIAGVFYNRLAIGMPLESDATVDFITKKGLASVSQADTQIDNPYNTYKYKGLPPGPICNPSLGSIMAALYPAQTDYLYFLTDPATGRAVFAKTLDEQIANKQKYLK